MSTSKYSDEQPRKYRKGSVGLFIDQALVADSDTPIELLMGKPDLAETWIQLRWHCTRSAQSTVFAQQAEPVESESETDEEEVVSDAASWSDRDDEEWERAVDLARQRGDMSETVQALLASVQD